MRGLFSMMAPSGVDGRGGVIWGTLAFAAVGTVESVEPPSILADIMSGGAVVLAYACYRFFPGKSGRACVLRLGWLCVSVCDGLRPVADAFCGVLDLMRSVYAYSQSAGVTMMGGLLTWLFVVVALLIGALFRRKLLSLAKYGTDSRRGIFNPTISTCWPSPDVCLSG